MPAHARLIGSRTTPPEIDSALKAIDPNAELIHLEGKRWWLGIRGPNPKAADPKALEGAWAAAMTKPLVSDDPAERAVLEVELHREFTMRQIMAEGFRPVALYTVERGELAEIVEDFRIRDHNWRTKTQDQIERELKAAVSADALNRTRIQDWGKKAAEAAGEAFRFVFKRARSVLVGNINQG